MGAIPSESSEVSGSRLPWTNPVGNSQSSAPEPVRVRGSGFGIRDLGLASRAECKVTHKWRRGAGAGV